MKIRHVVLAVVALGLLASCSFPHSELKSPCVGKEGSPCGPHRPVNDWWLKPSNNA